MDWTLEKSRFWALRSRTLALYEPFTYLHTLCSHWGKMIDGCVQNSSECN